MFAGKELHLHGSETLKAKINQITAYGVRIGDYQIGTTVHTTVSKFFSYYGHCNL